MPRRPLRSASPAQQEERAPPFVITESRLKAHAKRVKKAMEQMEKSKGRSTRRTSPGEDVDTSTATARAAATQPPPLQS